MLTAYRKIDSISFKRNIYEEIKNDESKFTVLQRPLAELEKVMESDPVFLYQK